MEKTFKYAFFTCALAYFLAAIPLVVFFATWGRSSSETIIAVKGVLIALTLMLSEYPWWGDFYYLAFLVPWLASSCVLILLIYGCNGGARRRALFTGCSMFIYYFAMWLVFLIHGLIYGWGDIAYDLIWLWPLWGFGFGYTAATIAERVHRKLCAVKDKEKTL